MAKCHVVQELRAYALQRLHPAKMMLGKASPLFLFKQYFISEFTSMIQYIQMYSGTGFDSKQCIDVDIT